MSQDIRSDGSTHLVTTTDAFTRDELLAGNKTALMLHGRPPRSASHRAQTGCTAPALALVQNKVSRTRGSS